ncbi:MAG TPA: hypothetical protein PK431_13965 [Chitinophagales bacterium]|nr:hypothetical protein [Chitinophagales bacterium]
MEFLRKFYDVVFDLSGGGNGVVKTENISEVELIECECGCHLLRVESDADIYINFDGTRQVHQTYYLAMFSFGSETHKFFKRFVIAWKYLRTGKMFRDQLSLTPEEATKLSFFIKKTNIETEQ